MCFGGPKDKDAEGSAAKNKEIDRLLRADEKKQQREVKLLLLGKLYQFTLSDISCSCMSAAWNEIMTYTPSLAKIYTGAGESGKSTVLKQMRLIYAQGFSKPEKEEWRAIIFNNLLGAYKVVLEAMDELDIQFEHENTDVGIPYHAEVASSGVYTD